MVNLDYLSEQLKIVFKGFNFSSLRYIEFYNNGPLGFSFICSKIEIHIELQEDYFFTCIIIIDDIDKIEDKLKFTIYEQALALNSRPNLNGHSSINNNMLIYYLNLDYDEFCIDDIVDTNKLEYLCASLVKEFIMVYESISYLNNSDFYKKHIANINAAITPVLNKHKNMISTIDDAS